MKAEELMKGNWVFSKRFQRPVQIVAVASRVLYYVDGVLRTENVGDVSPIPLTPEILEKNGFVPYEEDRESFHDENCVFIKQSSGGYGVCIDKKRTISGLFHHVHELQHALKLCGSEKEITL